MTTSYHYIFLTECETIAISSSLSLSHRNKLDIPFDQFHFLFAAGSDASIDTEETQPCDPSQEASNHPSPSQEDPSHPSPSQAPIHPVQAPGTLPPLPPTFSPITHNWGSGHTMMEAADGAVQEEGEGDIPVQGVYPIQGV